MRVAPWLLLVGCVDPPPEGTAVGNPGNLDVDVVDVPDGVSLESVTVAARALVTDRCPGLELVDADVVLDALGPSSEPVPLAGGEHCGGWLVLEGDAPIVVTGATDAGTAFTLELDPELLELGGPFWVDDTTLLLGLSLGALDPAELDALGPVVELSPEDPLTEELAATASGGVWRDVDADGRIDAPDEVLATAIGDAQAADAGCGCRSASVTGPWWLALVAWALLRRRAHRLARRQPA